jgi:hypothetical protein
MPRNNSKPNLAQGLAGLALIVGALIAYQLGVFNAIGKLLVDHSINSTQREVERQKAENEESAAQKP